MPQTIVQLVLAAWLLYCLLRVATAPRNAVQVGTEVRLGQTMLQDGGAPESRSGAVEPDRAVVVGAKVAEPRPTSCC